VHHALRGKRPIGIEIPLKYTVASIRRLEQSHLRFNLIALSSAVALVTCRCILWRNPRQSRLVTFSILGGENVGPPPHVLSNFRAAANPEPLSGPYDNKAVFYPAGRVSRQENCDSANSSNR